MTTERWKIYIDRDLERAGFDASVIEGDGVAIAYSERLSAVAMFTVVVTYFGGKLLNKATDGALTRPIGQLVDFARSKEARLRIEFEERNLDPRIRLVMAKVEGVDHAEFQMAVDQLRLIGPVAKALLDKTPEYIEEMFFVWNGERWVGTYYLTEGGDAVDF